MIVMGMFTGARIESLYRIRKRDVDLDAATVLIGAEGDKTEAGQDRLIPIAQSLLPTIQRLVDRADAPEDYLLRFRGKGDKRSDPDGKRFGRLKEKLFPGEGRKATFHSFRRPSSLSSATRSVHQSTSSGTSSVMTTPRTSPWDCIVPGCHPKR